jgi:hypothetical protein
MVPKTLVSNIILSQQPKTGKYIVAALNGKATVSDALKTAESKSNDAITKQ